MSLQRVSDTNKTAVDGLRPPSTPLAKHLPFFWLYCHSIYLYLRHLCNSKHQTLRKSRGQFKVQTKIMSGLIDMWTSEVKKMRNDTNGLNPCEPDSPKSNQVIHHWSWSEALLKRVNSPPLAFPVCSEASISMLVECFSP
ncbi:hypothetical protein L1887_24913 [Cichorium endivia]|nr:hypothetical protein L1887_24913 [Cichorium endivia]